jgi:hypothetical protein
MLSNDQIAAEAFAVTPSDTVARPARALYVGTGGNVSVVMAGGQTVTFANVPAGMLLPIEVGRVLATGTTASNIVALL